MRRDVAKPVLIDTQLLILLIVGLTNPDFILRHRRLAPVYNQKHFGALQTILAKAPKLVSTPHILAETSNLLRQSSDPMRSQIMETFKNFIICADERAVLGVRAAEHAVFIRLGLTDAAILSLDPAEVQVLTVDHDLHIASSQEGFDVVNISPFLFE